MNISSSRQLKKMTSAAFALIAITMITVGIISAKDVSELTSPCSPSDLPFAVARVAEHLITLLFS